MRGNENKQAGQQQLAPGVGVKSVCRGAQAEDVTDGADQHQLAPAEMVDHQQRRHRENKIGKADDDRLQQGRLRALARHSKDVRGVID